MPELPEVETIRRSLAGLEGEEIRTALIHDGRLTRPASPAVVAAGLAGAVLAAPRRRGKYLILPFVDGRSLLVHLRMTGAFLSRGAGEAPVADPSHLRAELRFSSGRRLLYTDIRRFGTWQVLGPAELEAHLGERLGPEPLEDWPRGSLATALSRRRRPLLSALLDQRTVAGVGTIYALEALHAAGLAPTRPSDTLGPEESARLQQEIIAALTVGLEAGGASIRDYRRADGSRGRMQERLRVYGRAGDACAACGAVIERQTIGGRSAFWCPACQPS